MTTLSCMYTNFLSPTFCDSDLHARGQRERPRMQEQLERASCAAEMFSAVYALFQLLGIPRYGFISSCRVVDVVVMHPRTR